jgi:hypothetical protein
MVYSLRRMEVMSSLAMRRVADQILADATRVKSKTKPADVASPMGLRPNHQACKKAPGELGPDDSSNGSGYDHH